MPRCRHFASTAIALSSLLALPFLAACGGGGDDDGGGFDISGVSQEDKSTKVAGAEVVVEVKDNSFSPETITIKPGSKVVWKWVGTQNTHSIQLSGNTSPEQSSGTFERVFDQTGNTFAYQCGVHKAAMTGKIVIE